MALRRCAALVLGMLAFLLALPAPAAQAVCFPEPAGCWDYEDVANISEQIRRVTPGIGVGGPAVEFPVQYVNLVKALVSLPGLSVTRSSSDCHERVCMAVTGESGYTTHWSTYAFQFHRDGRKCPKAYFISFWFGDDAPEIEAEWNNPSNMCHTVSGEDDAAIWSVHWDETNFWHDQTELSNRWSVFEGHPHITIKA